MSWKRPTAKLRDLFARKRRDVELAEELRAHIEMEEQENREAGMSREEAHYAALRKFGNVTRAEEDSREAWSWTWLETAIQDVKFALRLLVRDRAFTAVAVLSLAVGIGVNTALFSLADAILLRPLSVFRPSEVVSIVGNSPSEPLGDVSYRDYLDFRDQSKSFDGLVAYALRSFGFATKPGELPQKKSGMYVTGNFFSAMGVESELGRGFREDEDQVPGRDAVVVLGHDFWVSQLGADPSIVGKTVRLNGIDFTVTGVAPESFTGMDQLLRPAMYVPLAMAERLEGTPGRNLLEKRDDRELDMKGRLKSGTSVAQAQAEIAAIAASLAQEYPATDKDQGVTVMTELKVRVARNPPDAGFIALLMAMAGVVLLVACANLASLQLSRARARTREIAIRLAIGAGRKRLLRQMMTESLILALAGGAASLPFAQAGTAFLRQIRIPTDLPFVLDIRLNGRVLVFSLAITVLTAVLFGLAPALQASATNLVTSLKSGDAEGSGRQRLWGRKTLVIAQVSLSLVLMVMATVLYRAFHFLTVQGPGFRTDNLLMMSFDPRLVRYSDEQTQQFYKQLLERVRSAPGVKSAALTQVVPFSPEQNTENIAPEGYELPKGRDAVTVFLSFVDSGYFDTIGLPIVRGRTFRESDTAEAPMVAVVNGELAKKYWPGVDPIGKRFRVEDDEKQWIEVVGVAKTGKYLWLGEPPTPYLYLPLGQHPQARMTLLAQSAAEPASLVSPLREVVRSLDASQPIFNVRTMRETYQMRAAMIILLDEIVCAMGLVGLLLALVGLYGLMAYSVSQRTREIGIRMAIGANRASVVRMVLRQGLKLVLSGTAIGLAISFAAETGIDGIFNTTHRDPVAYLIVAPALLAVAMLATWIPARRASRVDPLRALRCE